MNMMVRKLEPDIIINNRSKIPEDFDTPEQRIEASQNRPWESCMTFNDSGAITSRIRTGNILQR